jgi:hypothetical protein
MKELAVELFVSDRQRAEELLLSVAGLLQRARPRSSTHPGGPRFESG